MPDTRATNIAIQMVELSIAYDALKEALDAMDYPNLSGKKAKKYLKLRMAVREVKEQLKALIESMEE